MPNIIKNEDIQFQPKTQGYSFSRILEEKKKTKFRMNILFTLILGLSTYLILVFIILAVLNFFNILSLNTLSPVFKNLPKYKTTENINAPHEISNTNQFVVSGTLQKYNDKTITVRYSGKITIAEYTLETKFYEIRAELDKNKTSTGTEDIGILKYPTSVLREENIGRNVTIQYKKKGNRIILNSLSLY